MAQNMLFDMFWAVGGFFLLLFSYNYLIATLLGASLLIDDDSQQFGSHSQPCPRHDKLTTPELYNDSLLYDMT